MKRTLYPAVLIALALCLAPLPIFGSGQSETQAQAQNPERGARRSRHENRLPRQTPESLTINGILSLINGRIALQNGQTTYYVHGLERLLGFVDGLKEGAAVTLEGFAFDVPPAPEEQDTTYRSFFVEKLTLNGKEYETPRRGIPTDGDLPPPDGDGRMYHHGRRR